MFIKITGYREVSPGHPMRLVDLGHPMRLFDLGDPMMLIVNTEKIEDLKDLGDGTYMVTLDGGTVEYTDRDGFDTLCKVLEIGLEIEETASIRYARSWTAGKGEAKKDE